MGLILPDEQRENKFRYSKKELDWCQKNENIFGNTSLIMNFSMKKIQKK